MSNSSLEFDNTLERSHVEYNPTDHSSNINKRLMERDNMFGISSRNEDFKHYGEITGEKIDVDEQEKGMPLRSMNMSSGLKKGRLSDKMTNNNRLDFDMFGQDSDDVKNKIKKNRTSKVSYLDQTLQSNLNFSGLDEVQDTILSLKETKIDPCKNLSLINNNFSWNIFNILQQNKYNDGFVISPINMMLILITFYLGSKSDTEKELHSFFQFPDKHTTMSGINNLSTILKNSSMIKYNTIIVESNIYKYINPAFSKYVKNLVDIDVINITTPEKLTYSTMQINSKFKKITNNILDTLLVPSSLTKKSLIIGANSMCIIPFWKYPFPIKYTKPYYFKGESTRKIKMMELQGKKINYVEDNLNQVIELEFTGNMCMGFILPKKHDDQNISSLNSEKIIYYVENMKKLPVEIIKIPKFKQHSKFRFGSLLYQMGLNNLFSKANLTDMITLQQYLYVSDFTHQIFIYVDERGKNNSNDIDEIYDTGFSKPLFFNADHTFIYYVRHIPTNTIISIGLFN